MKHKMIVTGMMIFLLFATVCGCGKKKVNYEVKDNNSTEESGSSSLAQFKELKNWEDQWTVPKQNADGEFSEEQKLFINAEIVVPDVDAMSVVETEQTVIDETFRKQFLNNFFENGELYYHDKTHYTKSELEQAIAGLEETLNEFKATIEPHNNNYPALAEQMTEDLQKSEEELQQWKELLPNASDNYTVATEFGTYNEYAGYLGEILFHVTFDETGVAVRPFDQAHYGPESLREYNVVSQSGKSGNSDESAQNECKFSMADAQKLAENFMKNIGRSNQIFLEKNNLTWYGKNVDEQSNVKDEKYTVYGYSFTYGTGIDGIDFLNSDIFPVPESDIFIERQIVPKRVGVFRSGDIITITVTDEGITEVVLENALDIVNVTKQIKLLSLDTIKEIMKKEAMEHSGSYCFDINDSFNRMELIYLKLKDDSKEGFFSYVPTWCLYNHPSGGGGLEPMIFVNAIDGNVIRQEIDEKNNIYYK